MFVFQADRLAAFDCASPFFVSRKGAKLAKVRRLLVLYAVSWAILAGGERIGNCRRRSVRRRI